MTQANDSDELISMTQQITNLCADHAAASWPLVRELSDLFDRTCEQRVREELIKELETIVNQQKTSLGYAFGDTSIDIDVIEKRIDQLNHEGWNGE